MSKRTFVLSALIVLLVVLGVAGYYVFSRDTFEPGVEGGEQERLSDREIDRIVKRVGDLLQLPQGEDPIVASIVNIEELVQEQPFYRGAMNGDVLLIYQKASKAIIYSPTRDILVNVGPIIIDQAAQEEALQTESEDGDVSNGENADEE